MGIGIHTPVWLRGVARVDGIIHGTDWDHVICYGEGGETYTLTYADYSEHVRECFVRFDPTISYFITSSRRRDTGEGVYT